MITVNRGGPGYVVDRKSGIRVPADSPVQLAEDLAHAVRRLVLDQGLLQRLSLGAQQRIRDIGIWSNKIDWLLNLYGDVIADSPSLQRRNAA